MYELIHQLPHAPWQKPSRNEEEYFHRLEFAARRRKARRREEERAREEQEREKELHRGRCPGCGGELEDIRLRGVRADQCPVCGGVWLENDTFETLTRSEEPSPLTALFRDVLLENSLGEAARIRKETAERGRSSPP